MWGFSHCAVVVAHPDDEILWPGGVILMHPESSWTLITLCRGSDPDRGPKFHRLCEQLDAVGRMGDLDDGPEQRPLDIEQVCETILQLLPERSYDLILTHGRAGEYTRHLRHEETHRAVMRLWGSGRIDTPELWTFAYEDGNRDYLPRPIPGSDLQIPLPEDIRRRKYEIITRLYGFGPDSWEARTTPSIESFMTLRHPAADTNP